MNEVVGETLIQPLWPHLPVLGHGEGLGVAEKGET